MFLYNSGSQPPYNTVPHVVETLNHNIIFTLLPNCNVGTVMNYNINI